jgi:hypothetical protein
MNEEQPPQQPRDSLSWPDVSKPSTGHQPPYGQPQSGYPQQQPGPGYGPPAYKGGGGGGGRIVLLVAILLAVVVAAGVLGWLIFN